MENWEEICISLSFSGRPFCESRALSLLLSLEEEGRECAELGIQALTALGDGSVLRISSDWRSEGSARGQALMQEKEGAGY